MDGGRTIFAQLMEFLPVYGDLAQVLIARARNLYSDEAWGANLKATAYALDSTKAAVKMHTLVDLRGNIPSFITITITKGNVHDVNFMDDFIPEAESFYIMDRAYNDFERLNDANDVEGLGGGDFY